MEIIIQLKTKKVLLNNCNYLTPKKALPKNGNTI